MSFSELIKRAESSAPALASYRQAVESSRWVDSEREPPEGSQGAHEKLARGSARFVQAVEAARARGRVSQGEAVALLGAWSAGAPYGPSFAVATFRALSAGRANPLRVTGSSAPSVPAAPPPRPFNGARLRPELQAHCEKIGADPDAYARDVGHDRHGRPIARMFAT